ncbi:MAG: excinuclease ABC subunit B [Candidatus Marinamargulisbacteria bacterium]
MKGPPPSAYNTTMDFKLVSEFSPNGDQPKAIQSLVEGLEAGKLRQTLLGVTGSGKTFTLANVIEKINRPTLIIAHNKTLAAQLCAEFRSFFPDNAVEFFISYYDYYQPEAYMPSRDVYIEKEADINEEIERLRHRATRSLMTREDVIIVSSVSCIYGLGLPQEYVNSVIKLKVGQEISRRDLLLKLDKCQYERQEIDLKAGQYRIKGESIDIVPSWETDLIHLEFFGDTLDFISQTEPVSGRTIRELESIDIFPATHYVVQDNMDHAMASIRSELKEQLEKLNGNDKIVEAKRLETRTKFDLDMIDEIGYCKGIENYSRHISSREEGEPAGVLLDFFPDDYLTIIDESHVTVPQIRGMYNGDRSRKEVLVQHGFRLPSAKDNRPLQFHEFEQRVSNCIYTSATPGPYEQNTTEATVEQIIRPTGLIDPEVEMRPTKGQIDDLIAEIKKRIERNERTLVTTLTKQMSEDLTTYLDEKNIKVQYLHSDIKTLDRIDILHDLRKGKYDVLIGVNLLREGLDLPEVSLVAIMDADKEGFLRNERSLIQTIGRAARNSEGRVILYGDVLTDSIKGAVSETNRRRKIQVAHNKKHGITPTTIIKKITDIKDSSRQKIKKMVADRVKVQPSQLPTVLARLESDMEEAAKRLEFELAAVIRDQIDALKQEIPL